MAETTYQPLEIESVSLQQAFDDAEISLEMLGGDIALAGGSTMENDDLSIDLDNMAGNTNYELLENKPKIQSVTLEGDKSFSDLGLQEVTNLDLLGMYNTIVRG